LYNHDGATAADGVHPNSIGAIQLQQNQRANIAPEPRNPFPFLHWSSLKMTKRRFACAIVASCRFPLYRLIRAQNKNQIKEDFKKPNLL